MDSAAFPPQKTYNFFRVFTLFLLFFVTSEPTILACETTECHQTGDGLDSWTLRRRANVRNEAHEKRGFVGGGPFEGEGVGVRVGVGDWGRDWESRYTAKDRGGQGGWGGGDIKKAAPIGAQKYKVSRVRGIP